MCTDYGVENGFSRCTLSDCSKIEFDASIFFFHFKLFEELTFYTSYQRSIWLEYTQKQVLLKFILYIYVGR